MIKIKIFLGVDHQGVKYKNKIIKYLNDNGIEVETSILENNPVDDYPDFAFDICHKVLKNHTLGILVCGSGIGMSIAANKVKGIKCARVFDENDAFTAKNHNGVNVIAMGINIPLDHVYKIIDTFIATKNPSEERHLRRIAKVEQIENGEYNGL